MMQSNTPCLPGGVLPPRERHLPEELIGAAGCLVLTGLLVAVAMVALGWWLHSLGK